MRFGDKIRAAAKALVQRHKNPNAQSPSAPQSARPPSAAPPSARPPRGPHPRPRSQPKADPNADLPYADELADEPPMAAKLSHNEQEILSGDWITMASSNVERMRFELNAQPTAADLGALFIHFKSKRTKKGKTPGTIYRYGNVPLALAVAFVETDSPGRFVWRHFRAWQPQTRTGSGMTSVKPNVVRLALPGE